MVLPQARVKTNVNTIPGTDGQKMSKSYGNTIDPFAPEKELKKEIMAIKTNSTPLSQPKDPSQCAVFGLYSVLAEETQVATLRARYLAGGYGYGQAKQALFALILERFRTERQHFQDYMKDHAFIEQILIAGEAKARDIAERTLENVRAKLGYAQAM